MRRVFCCLMLSLVCVGAADAATRYTDHRCGNISTYNPATRACTGGSATSRTTIAGGRALTQPGDTLIVRGGTYNEALLGGWIGGTSWSNPVTIRAASGETVIMRPSSSASGSYVLRFHGGNARYIELRGIRFDADLLNSHTIRIECTDSANTATCAHHIRLRDCEIANAGNGQGIIISRNNPSNQIINCDIHHNGVTGGTLQHGLYVSSANNLIERNRIHHNAAHGIQFYSARTNAVNDNILRSNAIYSNGTSGVTMSHGARGSAHHNVIWGNGRLGLQVNYGGTMMRVYNNVIYGNGAAGLVFNSGSNNIGRNNIIWGNDGAELVNNVGAAVSHNLCQTSAGGCSIVGRDPLFVNPGAGNFRLRSGSPAIDAGTATICNAGQLGCSAAITVTNCVGNCDIGAYEFGR
jgi:parallel beta-helix repeat protein